MEIISSEQLKKWQEWQAPMTTALVLGAFLVTFLISDRTTRLLNQGTVAITGAVHILHDRNAPRFFVDISSKEENPTTAPTQLAALGAPNCQWNSLDFGDAQGELIKCPWKESVKVTFSNPQSRRTWWGGNPSHPLPESHDYFPKEVLPLGGYQGLSFTYCGQLVQARRV